eukprot:3675551-Pleurochrysis_carterae.AAC.1
MQAEISRPETAEMASERQGDARGGWGGGLRRTSPGMNLPGLSGSCTPSPPATAGSGSPRVPSAFAANPSCARQGGGVRARARVRVRGCAWVCVRVRVRVRLSVCVGGCAGGCAGVCVRACLRVCAADQEVVARLRVWLRVYVRPSVWARVSARACVRVCVHVSVCVCACVHRHHVDEELHALLGGDVGVHLDQVGVLVAQLQQRLVVRVLRRPGKG